MELVKFLLPPTDGPILNKIVHYYSIGIFVVAGIIYTYDIYAAIYFTLIFPSTNNLSISVWMLNISLRLLSLWMPFILVLNKLNAKSIIVWIVYVLGCLVAIILSCVGAFLIDKYRNPGAVRDEYVSLINTAIKDHQLLPNEIVFTAENQECCGWSGPMDFFVNFDIGYQIDEDLEFMQQLQRCVGDIWKVEKISEGKLHYELEEKDHKVLKGCGKFYKEQFLINCYFVFYVGIFVIIGSVVFIAFAIILFKNLYNSNNPTQTHAQTRESPVYPVYSQIPEESKTLAMTTYNSPENIIELPVKTKRRKSRLLPDDPTAGSIL